MRTFIAVMVIGSSFVLGCGPSEIVRSTRWNVIDRHVAIDDEAPTNPEATKVVHGATYQVRVALSPKDAKDATEQSGEWVFYQDDRLFGRFDAGDIDFSSEPTVLALDAHSSSKRSGNYKYELYVDDELAAEIPVEIIPAPRYHPAPMD